MIHRGLNKVIATLVMLLLSSPLIVSARQDQDTAAIDAYIAAQARRERGEEYREARKVVSGDLTHDGVPETVVLYTIEGQHGTNLSVQYLAVFVRHDGKLTALTHADIGGRGKSAREVELTSVEDNSILLDTLDYGPKDAACCPSVKGKTRYILSGKVLREQKRGTVGLSGDILRTVRAHHRLFYEKGSGASSASDERRSDSGEATGAEDHHAFYIDRELQLDPISCYERVCTVTSFQ